jgi:hypothetical protein
MDEHEERLRGSICAVVWLVASRFLLGPVDLAESRPGQTGHELVSYRNAALQVAYVGSTGTRLFSCSR